MLESVRGSSRRARLVRALVTLIGVVAVLAMTLAPASGYAASPPGPLFFGVSDGGGLVNARAGNVNASAQRLIVEWSQIEWSAGYHLPAGAGFLPWNTRILELDQRVLATVGAGLTPVLTVVDAPAWTGDRPRGPVSVATEQLYRDFVVNLVNRYKNPPYNVKYWEIWSEPDGGENAPASVASRRSYGSYPAEFARLLSTVYPAIKANDPQATVIMGSMAYDWFDNADSPGFNQGGMFNYSFLGRVLDAGGANYVDMIGFNAYRSFAPGWEAYTPGPERDVAAKATWIRTRMAEKGVSKPLIAMEAGVWNFGTESIPFAPDPSAPASVVMVPPSDEVQVAGVVQTYARALAADLRGVFWYTLVDYDANKGYGLLGFPPGYSEKPAAAAYRTVASKLRGATYLGPVEQSSVTVGVVEGYRFRGPGGNRITVLWAAGLPSSSVTVNLPVLGSFVYLSVPSGVLTAAPALGGLATVTTTGTPVIVEEQKPLPVDPNPSPLVHRVLVPVAPRATISW